MIIQIPQFSNFLLASNNVLQCFINVLGDKIFIHK